MPDERLRNIAVRGLNSDEVAEPNCFAAVAAAAAFDKGEQWLDELNAYIAENKRFARIYYKKRFARRFVRSARNLSHVAGLPRFIA